MRFFRISPILLSVFAVASIVNATHSQDLSGGGWRGTWYDDNSGHTGPLRGSFKPTNDGSYRVVFTGRFAAIVPFRYSTKLNVVGHDGDKVILGGSSRLPLFGQFNYNGIADGNNFEAQYDSRKWKGSFRMTR